MEDETATPGPETPAGIGFDLFCQKCGYNLRTLTGDRCPECGYSLATVRSPVPQIPWVHRRRQGSFRAYWRTVWMVMFRQRAFGEEMARPVSYADAQRFRWVTILHVYLSVLFATVAMYVITWPAPFQDPFWDAAYSAFWLVAVLHICFLLFLAAATGVPGYFFHPRDLPVEQQNRAIAMSYYACGPLAMAALPLAKGVAAFAIGFDGQVGLGLLLFAVLFACGQVAAWWLDLTHIARRILPQRQSRAVLVAVCVPALWLLLAGVVFIGLPLLVLYVLIILAPLA